MSEFKFAPDLFLEKQELDRLKKFLDDEGFRAFLIANTENWGFVDRQSFYPDNSVRSLFDNALVTEDVGQTIKHNDIRALNGDGKLIYRAATNQIAVPADNQWYWVKISYQATPIELGKWVVDANGNMTGGGGELLTILRGEPNFPSRIRFPNAIFNTAEYDVLEVIDDNNAVLNGAIGTFNAESGLLLEVVGTFTEGVAPPASSKFPFQYDGCNFELVLEVTPNTPPTLVESYEFVVARVKNDGVSVVVQDKRAEKWKTKANYRLSKVDEVANPLIGPSRIMYDHLFSTKDRNKLFMQWVFQSTNYTVNSNLNMITINAGFGGKFKTVADFTNGDFNGWRLYSTNGKYLRIVNSILTGGQINCYFDRLEINYFSNDGGVTFTGDRILITPDAEKIELKFEAQDIPSTSIVETFPNLVQNFEFNINEHEGICPLLVYNDPTAYYGVQYRYKTNDTYTEWEDMPDDSAFGYYTESAFQADGSIKPIVLSNSYVQNVAQGYIKVYTGGLVELILNGSAYYPLLQTIITGDRLGVDRVTLDPAITPFNLVVGSNRIYQYFENGPFALTQDFFINLDNTGAINGNRFFLHFANGVQLNGFQLRIVTNYVDPVTFDLIEEFNAFDEYFASIGFPLQFELRHDGTQWQVEHSTYDRGATALNNLSIQLLNSGLSAAQFDINNLQAFQNDVEAAWVDISGSVTYNVTDNTPNTFVTTAVGFSQVRYKLIGKTCHIQVNCRIDTFTGNGTASWRYVDVVLPALLTAISGQDQHGFASAGRSTIGNIYQYRNDVVGIIKAGTSTLRINNGESEAAASGYTATQQHIQASITFEIA